MYIKKLFDNIAPRKIVEYMNIGEDKKWEKTKSIKDAFYQYLNLPKLVDEDVLIKSIIKGVSEGVFGYISLNMVKWEYDEPLFKHKDIFYKKTLREDEIDLENGLIVIPEAIPKPEIKEEGKEEKEGEKEEESIEEGKEQESDEEDVISDSGKAKIVGYEMELTRSQLYKTFNALGNLVDKAGKIKITIKAESEDGFDQYWLRNAVEEPLEESDIEYKKESR